MGRKVNSLTNIFANTIRDEEGGCLLYQGSTDKDGYARVSFKNKTVRANRLVYQLLQGLATLPQGQAVHHVCSNRRCIEPTHLAPLSHKQNIIQTKVYVERRKARLRTLIEASPHIEFVSILLTSTRLRALWECQGRHVKQLLTSMHEAFPQEFAQKQVRKGRGRKPALFELRIQSSLVEKLFSEEEPTEGGTEMLINTGGERYAE